MISRGPRSSALDLNLIALAEQIDDDDKKAHCVQSFNKSEDEAKVVAHQIVGPRDTLEVCEEQLSNADDRIAVVQKSTSELHASVAKAFQIRQTQHSELVTLTANTVAVTHLLKVAINRLNKFCAPKLHKLASKAEFKCRRPHSCHRWRDHHRGTDRHHMHERRSCAVVAG